jgi:hypothetical protein
VELLHHLHPIRRRVVVSISKSDARRERERKREKEREREIYPAGRNADGAHEELRLGLDDDVHQLRQSSLGVIVIGLTGITADLKRW